MITSSETFKNKDNVGNNIVAERRTVENYIFRIITACRGTTISESLNSCDLNATYETDLREL